MSDDRSSLFALDQCRMGTRVKFDGEVGQITGTDSRTWIAVELPSRKRNGKPVLRLHPSQVEYVNG